MSAIPGTRRQFRELVDGTIRVMIDIDPPYRKAFLDAFGEIDMAVALVPLATSVGPAPVEPKPEPELKGGELAKLAGKWCQREDFQEWVSRRAVVPCNADGAAEGVRTLCGVHSRRELDHNSLAAELFEKNIRRPFMAHIGAVA